MRDSACSKKAGIKMKINFTCTTKHYLFSCYTLCTIHIIQMLSNELFRLISTGSNIFFIYESFISNFLLLYCFDDFSVNFRMVFNSSLALVCTAQFSPPPWATYLPCCLKLPALPIIKASTGANNTNKWWKELKEILKSLLKRKSL